MAGVAIEGVIGTPDMRRLNPINVDFGPPAGLVTHRGWRMSSAFPL
jgi:hypothetical protein